MREALQQYYKSHLASYSEKSGTRHKRAKAASRTRVKMGSCQEVESKNISFSTTAALHFKPFLVLLQTFPPFCPEAEGRENINITLQQKRKSWHISSATYENFHLMRLFYHFQLSLLPSFALKNFR